MRSPEHRPTVELRLARRDCVARPAWARIRRGSSLRGYRRVVQVSKSDLMARGVALNLLQMAKRVGQQCKAAEYEDLSGEKSLTLDRVVVDDRGSHRA